MSANAPVRPKTKPAKAQKSVSLALQGGGAHGAFTWGVLDQILEDGRLHVEAFSGASAGAMNAVAYADGWAEGGRDGARQQLERFWRGISIDGRWSGVQRKAIGALMGGWTGSNGDANPFLSFWSDWFQQTSSPYDFNPLDINPLKDVLDDQIDFARIRGKSEVKLFISATNVETGKIKIFETGEIAAEHVLASACLPTLFKAITIKGESYWDGGYMGNPALYPLFYGVGSDDVILVQINPVFRKGIPMTAQAIQTRLNEITFNATLLREFRAVNFVTRLIEKGLLPQDQYKNVRMHRIDSGEVFKAKDAVSKNDSHWDSLLHLKEAGRAATRKWLSQNYDSIGTRATFDIATAL